MQHPLATLATRTPDGRRHGITSVCSAHPLVIEAALRQAARLGEPVLIEATCNQVNHQGGYTGMTPAAFAQSVRSAADEIGLDAQQLILGGDHLGPNPWRHLPPEEAMQQSEIMVAAYVAVGFGKIHLDTSMACAGEPAALPESVIVARAARLAVVAESAAAQVGSAPRYVIGTEVPVPGGAHEAIHGLQVTPASAAIDTVQAHRDAFEASGIGKAFERVIALVVQPGVEFGTSNVIPYVPERATALSAALQKLPGLVFESHSTDYQSSASLSALVQDGFAILKVGPALTFALREALYGLDAVAQILDPNAPSLIAEMEAMMTDEPKHWRDYYQGSATERRILRHFSYSDRIRYYWPAPCAEKAVERLLARFDGVEIPETLISQYLPGMLDRVRDGSLPRQPRALLIESVVDVLRTYAHACR